MNRSKKPIIFDFTFLKNEDETALKQASALLYSTIKREKSLSTNDNITVFLPPNLPIESGRFLDGVFSSINANVISADPSGMSRLISKWLSDESFEDLKIVSNSIWPAIHISEKCSLVNLSTGERLDYVNFHEKSGFKLSDIEDFMSLVGDADIGIKPVPLIGPKSAASMLSQTSLIDVMQGKSSLSNIVTKSVLTNKGQIAQNAEIISGIKQGIDSQITLNVCEKFNSKDLFAVLSKMGLLNIVGNSGNGIYYGKSTKVIGIDNQASLADFSESLENSKSFSFTKHENILYFCLQNGVAYAVQMGNGSADHMSPDVVATALKPAFENPSIKKVFEDASSSIKELDKLGLDVNGIGSDLFILNKYIFSAERDFNELAQEITGVQFDKSPLSDNVGDKIAYHGERTNFLLRISRALFPKMESGSEFYSKVEMPLISVISKMNKNGVSLDIDGLKKVSYSVNSRINELKNKAYELAGFEFDLGSPSEISDALFVKLGIRSDEKTRGGSPSTSDESLALIASQHPVIDVIREYRSAASMKGSNISNLLNEKTIAEKKVFATYIQMHAITGRLSCREPNLQGIPIKTEEGRRLRRSFIASSGMYVAAGDYSQIELRVLAHLSQDEILINAFRDGLDIHAITASQVFNIPLDDVTKEQRRDAKSINFGIIYAMSAFGLSKKLGVSVEESEKFISAYFNRFPKIKAFLDGLVDGARKNGYVQTITGRKIIIENINSSDFKLRKAAERASQNYPMQGSAADIVKKAMVDLADAFNSKGISASIIMQVHDELVIEFPKELAKECVEMMNKKMSEAIKLSVPMTVDIGMSTNWEQCHTIGEISKENIELSQSAMS